MNRKYIWLSLVTSLFLMATAFAAGFIVRDYQIKESIDFPILHQSIDLLESNAYYELPSSTQLEYGMIRGMLQTYGDPYTVFVEPARHEVETNRLEGSFSGISVQFQRNSEGFIILFPIPDGPAWEAGIMDGDRLIQVDEQIFDNTSSDEDFQAAIRGPEDETVKVIVSRPPNFDDKLEFNIERQDIPVPSVSSHLAIEDSRLGILDINFISANSPEEIETAVNKLLSLGATHFILDLRGNGGGLLVPGVDIARMFLADGIVIEQHNSQEKIEEFKVTRAGPLADFPLVVFVDHNTASSAEIIAGALQQHSRALLIGSPTFGKDSFQLLFNLDDGSSIHITSGIWLIPDFIFPNGDQGLIPDIALDPGAENPNQIILLAIESFFN